MHLVDTVAQQLEGIAGLFLGARDVPTTEVNLGDAVDCVRRLSIVADLQGDANCVLQERECVFWMSEQEVDATEVVQQPAEIAAVGQLLVCSLGALRVRPREHPVAFAIGDDRRLEVDVRGSARVVQALRELECALDVLTRGLEVAATPVAPRTPGKNVRAELIGGNLGLLRDLERLVEQRDRGLDAVELKRGTPGAKGKFAAPTGEDG